MSESAEPLNYNSFAIKQAEQLILHGTKLCIESNKLDSSQLSEFASLLAVVVGMLEEENRLKGGD